MPDPNYSNYSDEPATDSAPEQQDMGGGQDSKNALVPKAFCPRAKVGDEIVSRVVAVHEGEFELEYEDSKPGEESKPEPTEDSMSDRPGAGESSMSSMME